MKIFALAALSLFRPTSSTFKVTPKDGIDDGGWRAMSQLRLVIGIVVVLAAALVLRGLYKAMKLNDPFEQVAASALFVLVGMQAFINIAVNLALVPTKGMTLPFISYGGSSTLAMGLTLGLALALTSRRPGAYANADNMARAGAFG